MLIIELFREFVRRNSGENNLCFFIIKYVSLVQTMAEYHRIHRRGLIVVCQAPGATRVAGRRSSGTFAAGSCPSDYRRWFAVATKCSSTWPTSTTRSSWNPCWMSARCDSSINNNDVRIYIRHGSR